MDAIDRIATRTVRAAGRIALEAGIASIDKLLKEPTPNLTRREQNLYRSGLANAQAELHNLLASMVE